MGILCAVVFYFFSGFFGFFFFFSLSSFLTCSEVNNHSHRERKDLLEKA
jgi:hypothetical protein